MLGCVSWADTARSPGPMPDTARPQPDLHQRRVLRMLAVVSTLMMVTAGVWAAIVAL